MYIKLQLTKPTTHLHNTQVQSTEIFIEKESSFITQVQSTEIFLYGKREISETYIIVFFADL
jgi:hypothetical protein